MRLVSVAIAVLLAGCATTQRPTDVAFGASEDNAMLVVAENGGVAYAPGGYRFVRVNLETRQVLDVVDIASGPDRRHDLFGQRPGAIVATHVFHYAIVSPGDYALVYLDASGVNYTSSFRRWICRSTNAPIYHVGAGSIAVVRAPDRPTIDVWRFDANVSRNWLRRFPPGTTLEGLRSEAKATQDFTEIVATNTSLTAPFRIAQERGALAFDAPETADLEQCLPDDDLQITLAPEAIDR